jgi:hypothetical protein
MRPSLRVVVSVLSVLVLVHGFAGAQKKTKPAAATPPAPSTVQASPVQKLKQALANSVLNPPDSPLGDYVQCEFTLSELLDLHVSPYASTLSGAESEQLKQQIIAEALSDDYKDALTVGATTAFVNQIGKEDFSGKTQSQALVTIMNDYSSSEESETARESFASAFQDSFPVSVSTSVMKYVDPTKGFSTTSKELDAKAPSTELSGSDKEAVAQVQKRFDEVQTKQVAQQTQIINTARTNVAAFLKPPDVGCAMSLLDYNETKRAYGKLVADEYMAVQVVVRNLNRDQEFQLHDVEFAVDVDPSGRHARFYSGRDKLLVRSFSVAQQNFDTRNLTVHSIQAVGSLLNAIVPVYGGSFGSAVGVFTGGAVPGLDKIWKDSTTDQLNLLNDTGFSSSINSRTVVPKSGVAMFVTFVPSLSFESGWWTQSCANLTYLGSRDSKGQVLPVGQATRAEGIDIDRALEPCLVEPEQPSPGSGLMKYKVQRSDEAAAKSAFDLFTNPNPVRYKKWSGDMFNTFRELTYVVIAGAHVFDESQMKANITKLTCSPLDTAGDIPLDGKDSITCTVSGANLGSVVKIRLRNTSDQKQSVDGPFKVAQGDPTSGTVAFPEKDLVGGASYAIFMLDKADIETATSAPSIHIAAVAAATDAKPNKIDLAIALPATVVIAGSHLKDVSSIWLTSEDKTVEEEFKPSSQSDTSLSIEILTTSKVAQVDASTKPVVFNVSFGSPQTDKSASANNLSITLSGKVAAHGKPVAKPKAAQKHPTGG